MLYQLEINRLVLSVFLGAYEKERKNSQPVEFFIKISSNEPFHACTSDELDDTICYEKLVDAIKQSIQNKHFKLIEKLTFEIFTLIKNQFPDKTISVKVYKKPPIAEVKDNCCFSIQN
jgi:7,8-dihydroneopterin aldolase/epimerase/oxygenase